MKYCGRCGTELEPRLVAGKQRGVCPSCGYIQYDDPKVAAGVVIGIDGRIVLGKRAHDPKLGLRSFPSGFVDAGEPPEEAAVREVWEETGLQVRIDRLIGIYAQRGVRTIFIAYAGSVVGGALVAGEECLEVGTFAPDALPDLAFDHDASIIEAWIATSEVST